MQALLSSFMPDVYGLLFLGAVYLLVVRILPRYLKEPADYGEHAGEASHAGH